jgi:hypothetical protein
MQRTSQASVLLRGIGDYHDEVFWKNVYMRERVSCDCVSFLEDPHVNILTVTV